MVALFRLKDTKVALSLATLFLWLIVALIAATISGAVEQGSFLPGGAVWQPRARLVKK